MTAKAARRQIVPVLIPLRLGQVHERWGRREFMRTHYLELLARHGLTPRLMSASFPREIREELLAEARGLLLPGGRDLDPARYGQPRDPRTVLGEEEEDELDLSLARWALARKLPMLCICRGCQVLAAAAGGSLHQHVPAVPAFGGESHGRGNPFDDGSLPSGLELEIEIDPRSRAGLILKRPTARVVCEHHQAVADPGQGMRVAARSRAGVIELFEAVDPDHFCLGIQSHLEADPGGDLEPLAAAFAAAVLARER